MMPGDPAGRSNPDDLGLSLSQFSDAWRVMCHKSPAYAHATGDGLDCVFSGVPVGFFNLALLTGRSLSSETLRRQAGDACAWAADKGVPWLLVATQETLAPGVDAAAELDSCGLAFVMPLTGMVASQITPATRTADGLQLTVPADDGGRAALLDVNAVAYGMELEAGKPFMQTAAFWNGHVPVLGLVEGRPASCAAVLMVEGYRYVAMVATDPAHQRRGYAEAAMRHALDEAAHAHGDVPTVLHATEAGRPIYERMGYRTIARHMVYMEKRFLDAH
jgi:ribosomal protein S18 acetylase RimI-like enzyme